MSRRIRGFEAVATWARNIPERKVILPTRGTRESAGYDFYAMNSVVIPPRGIGEFFTDVKAYMLPDEVLHLYPRSSIGIKRKLMIANTVPTVDADYYNNPTNDGEITIYLRNLSDEPVEIFAGDRIAQGIFSKYLTVDDEDTRALPTRTGGVGHTGR